MKYILVEKYLSGNGSAKTVASDRQGMQWAGNSGVTQVVTRYLVRTAVLNYRESKLKGLSLSKKP